jgi:hypothetical protein
VRVWVKFFAPPSSKKGIDIPKIWFDFFTLNLLHPDKFTRAKSLLESSAWKMVVADREAEICVSFSIPKAWPASSPLKFSIAQEEDNHAISPLNLTLDEVNHNDSAPSTMTVTPEYLTDSSEVENIVSVGIKRKLSKVPLVVSDVRSERIKKTQQHFKSSNCKGMSYLCRSLSPHPIFQSHQKFGQRSLQNPTFFSD